MYVNPTLRSMQERKVLLVDNFDSFTLNLRQLIEECGFGCDIVKNDQIDFPLVDRYQKILVSPGPGIPSESGKTCDLIREFASRKSILGVCLGHQAIAEVFGARLVRLSEAMHGVVKVVRIAEKSVGLFAGLPDEIDGGLYHSWTVVPESVPACLQLTATASDGTVMALSHREYDVQGIQFHPESIMTKHGKVIMRNWLSHGGEGTWCRYERT
jgi:anthranilate synthase component 2